jgi:hypothetical protein
LALRNPLRIYDIMFEAAAATLLGLGRDPKCWHSRNVVIHRQGGPGVGHRWDV